MAEQFRQIKRSVAELFRQIKRSMAEQFRQIKRSVADPHMEISFWFGKGDIPNEKIRLPPLEVHFGVGGCGHTDSAGGLVKYKMKGGVYKKPPCSRPPPLTCFFLLEHHYL